MVIWIKLTGIIDIESLEGSSFTRGLKNEHLLRGGFLINLISGLISRLTFQFYPSLAPLHISIDKLEYSGWG